jgi:hypothetical protein
MCRFLGKSLFQTLNVGIGLVAFSILIFGLYCLARNGNFNPFVITSLSLGVSLSMLSVMMCVKGFKSKCTVGLYLFFIATLLLAEATTVGFYYSPNYQEWLLNQVPVNLVDYIKENMKIARWILLGIAGAQAVAFVVGLMLCRGIKPRSRSGTGGSQYLLETVEDYGTHAQHSDVPGSFDTVGSSYRHKHRDLYKKYKIQMGQ